MDSDLDDALMEMMDELEYDLAMVKELEKVENELKEKKRLAVAEGEGQVVFSN